MNENDESKDMARARQLLEFFCKGDQDAVRLCEDLIYTAHIWDDIEDQDRDLHPRDINQAFCKALGHIPSNPVYQDNIKVLAPLSLIAALTWQIANRLAAGNEDERLGSFILRNGLLHVLYFIVIMAGIRQGDEEWGLIAGEPFWREFFVGYHQKYLDFLTEMKPPDKAEDENLQ